MHPKNPDESYISYDRKACAYNPGAEREACIGSIEIFNWTLSAFKCIPEGN